MLGQAFLSALVNLLLFVGIPLGAYSVFHRRRKRSFSDIAQRAGLRLGEPRYIAYAAAFSLAVVAALLLWPPDVEMMTRKGSAQHDFAGLGLTVTSAVMSLLYGVVKTGFAEELLFRGLIAGSLSRRLPARWANLVQALIFLLPHLLLLFVMPEVWPLLVLIFAGGLCAGWLRIASGSILAPWLIHAVANVAMCLSVAIRSA